MAAHAGGRTRASCLSQWDIPWLFALGGKSFPRHTGALVSRLGALTAVIDVIPCTRLVPVLCFSFFLFIMLLSPFSILWI